MDTEEGDAATVDPGEVEEVPTTSVDPAPAAVTEEAPPVTVDPAPIRGRKVEDVTLGRQAPRPAHQMGSINQAPDPQSISVFFSSFHFDLLVL